MGQMTISPSNYDGTQDLDFKTLDKNLSKLALVQNNSQEGMLVTLTAIDFLQACNRYIWKGLPENIPKWYIEKMLYYTGSLCFFKDSTDTYLTLPFAMVNGINNFGLPFEIQPISLNGTPYGSRKLAVGMFGEITDADAVIIYSSTPIFANDKTLPQKSIDLPILMEMAKRFGYMKKNMRQAFLSYIWNIKDEKQREALQIMLQGYEASDTEEMAILFKGEIPIENMAEPRTYESQSIWQDITSFNNYRLTALGIDNGGTFLKKERNISNEIGSQDSQTSIILDNGLKIRQYACEQINKIFGLNVSVEINKELEENDMQMLDKGNGKLYNDNEGEGNSLNG